MFDLFGTFSGHTGTEVRVKLLENIATDMSFYETRSTVCLLMRSMNLETWVNAIANESVYCDELCLMGLCYMYQRHCVVLTQNKLWSTVQADKPLNLLDLLNVCSVRLIYLGNLHFGALTWRPHLPKKVATKSPGFNIVEEYTLDDTEPATNETSTKGTSVDASMMPVNVGTTHQNVQQIVHKPGEPTVAKTDSGDCGTETTSDDASMMTVNVGMTHQDVQQIVHKSGELTSPKTDSGDCCTDTVVASVPIITEDVSLTRLDTVANKENCALPASNKKEQTPSTVVETNPIKSLDVQSDSPETENSPPTNEKIMVVGVEPAHYPWKRQVCVKLSRLQPDEINSWIKRESLPVISDVKGYGLRNWGIKVEPLDDNLKEDKTDQLIDHAKSLIDTAKSFITKPVHSKHHQKNLKRA